MQRRARPPKSTWVAWLSSCLILAIVIGGYVAVAHFLVGSETPASDLEADQRDALYFAIHAGSLFVALFTGFLLGKWLNGLGVAFALLFFVALATAMSAGQVVAFEAACHGQNNIIRHWTC